MNIINKEGVHQYLLHNVLLPMSTIHNECIWNPIWTMEIELLLLTPTTKV